MTWTWKMPRAVGLMGLMLLASACAKGTVDTEPSLEDVLSTGRADGADDSDAGASKGGASQASTGENLGATGGSGTGSQAGSGGAPSANTGGTTGGSTGASSTTGGSDAGALPGMSDAGTSPTGPACDPGLSACGSSCVDLKSSAANCGTCGHKCPGNQACDGAGGCTAPSGCTYASYGGHEYFFCTSAKNWLDARAACLSYGLDLAVIEGAPENDFIKLKGKQWIGLNDRDSENTWLWVSLGKPSSTAGISTAYRPWHADEPNNDCDKNWLGRCGRPAGEDCVEIYQDGTWNDGDCGRSQAFACETY